MEIPSSKGRWFCFSQGRDLILQTHESVYQERKRIFSQAIRSLELSCSLNSGAVADRALLRRLLNS